MTKKKTATKTKNKQAEATSDYLKNAYSLDADTDTERVLTLMSQSVDPFEFCGPEVEQNPSIEWYLANVHDRMGVERARRQGWKVLEGEHNVEIQAGPMPDHLVMYRPKSVGERVRKAEDNARRTAEAGGIAHETRTAFEQVKVAVDGDPYA